MKSYLFIGIDISKATMDVCFLSSSGSMEIHYHEFSNSLKGFFQLLNGLKQKLKVLQFADWRVCMENTAFIV